MDRQTEIAEVESVETAVRAYINAWHAGDAQEMDHSLHDDLIKRSVNDASTGDLSGVTKTEMVELTRDGGGGSPYAAAEVVVHHIEGAIASAQVATAEYLDYVHLAKTSGSWRIVHDLFRQRS